VEQDGAIRLGLRYVSGLREEIGKAIEMAESKEPRANSRNPQSPTLNPDRCPKCGCDDGSMLEVVRAGVYFCNNCAHDWALPANPRASAPAHRFASVDDLVNRTGIRREELQMLAEIGAFASFGYERREALWQVERAVRPAGELFEPGPDVDTRHSTDASPECPLPPMNAEERLVADYAGTHLTIGPHPMAMRRPELAMRGVLRASDLARARDGRRIRVAGTVITRQRPGTAKGFVFLTLEDETGIANVIIRPDLFARERFKILEEPFLLVDGVLQNQEGVTSVKAERLHGLGGAPIDVESHDFY
jgi:DNA polymerase III alpha subunit